MKTKHPVSWLLPTLPILEREKKRHFQTKVMFWLCTRWIMCHLFWTKHKIGHIAPLIICLNYATFYHWLSVGVECHTVPDYREWRVESGREKYWVYLGMRVTHGERIDYILGRDEYMVQSKVTGWSIKTVNYNPSLRNIYISLSGMFLCANFPWGLTILIVGF